MRRVGGEADVGVARHGANGRHPLLQPFAAVQVGNTFFGEHVGDVIGVNHYRRQGETGFFRQFPGVQFVDEGGLALLAEGLLHLDHQAFAARHIAD